MIDSEQHQHLTEWNRLNKDNAEQALASAIFISLTETSSVIDRFSSWLLAGTGATGALLIAQIGSVIPHLTVKGFRVSVILLLISAISGFVAKYKALHCQIQVQVGDRFATQMSSIVEKHGEAEEKITDYAEQSGLKLETEIDFNKVMAEYVQAFPAWAHWLLKRKLKKVEGNRQAGHQIAIKYYCSQINYTVLQAVLFLCFLCSGVWYATAM